MDNSTIAKEICERFGIIWDENETIPHLNDIPVSRDVLISAFSAISIPYVDLFADDVCANSHLQVNSKNTEYDTTSVAVILAA